MFSVCRTEFPAGAEVGDAVDRVVPGAAYELLPPPPLQPLTRMSPASPNVANEVCCMTSRAYDACLNEV